MKTGLFGNPRFEASEEDGYTAGVEKGGLKLSLYREHLFAWMENPEYRYRDVVLDATLAPGNGSGYSSAGFMFRQTGDSEYYYFLVSTRGYFRFDVVLNGTPEEIIGWTALESGPAAEYSLRIIADGSAFTFIVNGCWAGEASDDRIYSGSLSFCAQNYGESAEATARCRRLSIESRPAHIAVLSAESARTYPPAAEARRRLADSFASAGRYQDQVRQLQRLEIEGGRTAEDFFTRARGYIHMNLFEQALSALDRCLSLQPDHAGARLARADILYITGRIGRLEELLPSLVADFPDNAFLLNLAGNTAFAAENWEEARSYYLRAAEQEPETALYLEHAGRTADQLARTDDAEEYYGRAAEVYFRQEDYPGAERLVAMLQSRGNLSPAMTALQGKLLFQKGDLDRAFDLFDTLIRGGCGDGSVFFLAGLVLSARGEREKADGYYRSAVDAEPDFYLYRFRRAENSWLLGKDCSEDLDRALRLAPQDGWVLNLAGQVAMDTGDPGKAAEYLQRAVEALPEETDVLINLAEAFFRQGCVEEARELLETKTDDPAVMNYRGNLFSRRGDFERAAEAYEAAMEADPASVEFRENLAAAYIELDRPLKAEDILSGILEEHPNGRAYNLMGNCLGLTGQYQRAEAAYREALRCEPGWDEPKLNLADLYITLGAADEAEILLERTGCDCGSRGVKLREKLRHLTTETVRCSICDRTWTVPRGLEDQGSLRLVGEPPADLPAGKCPTCGKIYCIACASEHLDNGRFVCPDCEDYLKLNDDRLKYIFKEYFTQLDESKGFSVSVKDQCEEEAPPPF